MELTYGGLNWLAIVASIVIGQIVLTVWFVPIFGKKWAAVYGAASMKEHTKEVPSYAYGIGVACMALLVIGIAVLQQGLGVVSAGDGAKLGAFLAIHLAVATSLPGYAFLKRLNAFPLALGAQVVVMVVVSSVLGAWQ